MNEDKRLINATYLVKDLVAGDPNVETREDYQNLSGEDLRQAIKLILQNGNFNDAQKAYFLENTWRIHYKDKPPTISDFLTDAYIGPTALSIYPHVEDVLKDFWHPLSEYRHLLMSPHIGWGKSLAAAISALYVLVHLALMKNPKRYFNQSEAASIVVALISFSMKKATQLLVKPFYNILLTSPFFHRVKQEEHLENKQREYGTSRICWTTASKMEGAFQFTNDLHILTASDPANLLGLSMIQAVMSELSFFIDRGISPEMISRVYNDAKSRIYSRFGSRYFATTIMDSSPNDYDLPIDNYIFSGKAAAETDDEGVHRNYVVTGAHWEQEAFKSLYPQWLKTGRTFPVFRGDSGQAPEVLTEEKSNEYSKEEVYHVPIDLRNAFETDTKKMVKDYCGWPAGGEGKLIEDYHAIEQMFSSQLQNIYTAISAPANQHPEELVWNRVRDAFFIRSGRNAYEIYRAPREPRALHMDLSESGDVSGLSMAHMELNPSGEKVVVADFTLAISPEKSRINLDAIPLFILDLARKGRVPFFRITADSYGSANIIQRLKREGFSAERLSVDRDVSPYHIFVSWMKNGRIKAGRNIFLKNNLKSLIEITNDKGRQLIDHQKGKIVYDDGGGWGTSAMGVNAKDISDSLTGAAFTLINDYKAVPGYQWIDDEEVNQTPVGEAADGTTPAVRKDLLDQINAKFGLSATNN